jgi:hypothetical protein
MDPMIDFVRERTTDLQRTAESARRDRDLRQAATAAVSTTIAAVTASALSAVAAASSQPDDPCQGVACAPSGVRHAA